MPIEKCIFIPRLNSSVMYLVGKNAAENFQLIDDAKSHHIWFHVEGLPSCHVIAQIDESWSNKQLIPVIKQGALLCKMHSKYASVKDVPIIYTAIENIEKTDTIGSVLTKNEKKVVI